MKRFFFTLILLSLCLGSFAQLITPFTIRKQVTQRGGIRFISNVSATCTSGATCTTGQNQVPPTGTSADNDFTEVYVDIDSDTSTFMSSSDSLALPACSDITWAGLYWGAENQNTGGVNYATRNQVKLKVNGGLYQDLTADALQDNSAGFSTYHCFKDVTSIVTAAGNNARFTIANVATRVGGTNRFGGWSIVVIYKNNLQPTRNLTVFNGLSNVSGGNPITDIPISGFLTPLTGPVAIQLGLIVYDGDRSSTGDSLLFNGAGSFQSISDALNPANDIFNSTCSRGGVLTPFRNPSFNNTLGYDADIFIPNNSAKNYIGNNDTSAIIRQRTGGETFLTQVVTSAIDAFEPDLRAAMRVKDLNGGSIAPGDTLEYTLVAKNIGADSSINTYIVDTLEGNTIFVPGSIRVTAGANIGSKTDASSDDQGEFISASKVVRVRVGTGANATTGGILVNSIAGTDSTEIKFKVTAISDCVYLQCDNVANAEAYIYGTGNTSGSLLENGSSPGFFDLAVCPIPAPTNSTISASSCTAPAASSNSPVCAGGTINLNATTSTSANYSWSGPGGFTSTLRNPSISTATAAMAGTYTCTITIPGTSCSFTPTVTVVVNALPTTSPSSNSPVCAGSAINLSTPTVAGSTYSWTGPGGFTSSSRTPTRAASTAAMAGTYSITITNTTTGCVSLVGTTTVVVNALPANPTAGSNSPVCVGSSLNLTTPTVAGSTYSWTGPGAYTSTTQNPTLSPVTAAMAGTYSVTITNTSTGCTSAGAGTTTVVVNALPATPTAGSNSPVCVGSSINLTTPTVAGSTYSWTGPGAYTSTTQNPTLSSATLGMSGTYSVTVTNTSTGCTSLAGTVAVTVSSSPSAPTAGSNSPVCAGSAINLTASTIAGATYSWTGPGSFTSTIQNPTISSATAAMAGTYSVTASIGTCTSPAGTTIVVVNPIPATPTAGSNSPVCVGSAINLTTPTAAGSTYSWTGPASFTSTTQNPTRASATAAMAGTYSVTVTASGCTSLAGTTAVVVNALPATPTASSNSPACIGSAINLATPTVAGATYSWTGPGGYTSTTQNPSLSPATAAMAGTYSVTVTNTTTGCTSLTGTTTVVVNALPATPTAGSNSPVCAGTTINLTTPTAAGSTYSWTGPGGYTSSTQNPTIPLSTTAMAGTYSVTITNTTTGCTSLAGTTTVVVNAAPATPTAGSNSPVCVGSAINLTTPTATGATYSWTGPAGFTSTSQNPTISLATVAMSGTYSVTITSGGCTSLPGTVAVIVSAPPSAPTAGSNSPACIGSSINLTASTILGATYSWTGPGGFTSSLQNPTLTPVTAAMAGTYSVSVTIGICTSPAGTTTVVINTLPATPTAGSNSPVCLGSAINLTTPSVAGSTYSWTGPGGYTSTTRNPIIPSSTAAMAGTYSVTITNTTTGCTSLAGTTTVVINPLPATPTAGSNSPVCVGSAINLTTPTATGATYSWTGPAGFTSTTQNPTISLATVAMSGTYSVTITSGGCTSLPGTTDVIVSPPPVAPTAGSNSPACIGDSINLTASTIVGATYSWTGPDGFTSSLQNPTLTPVTAAMAGTYSVSVTIGICTSPAGTTTVVINALPAAPTAGSNSPVCLGSAINLTTPTVAGASYSWSGPAGYSSATQNPTIPSSTDTMAGTYSVTITNTTTGCTSLAGTTDVIINPLPETPTAGSNSPVCVGSAIDLTASTVTDATYSWTGPDGFTSATQNPEISSATLAMAGTYSVTITNTTTGCTSLQATTDVFISGAPATPTAGSNSPVCSGQSINLTASTIPGANYNWSGPAGFTGTTQDTTLSSSTVAMSGIYIVTASIGVCVSAPDTVVVQVNATPEYPSAASNSPVCVGSSINLTTSGIDSIYSWTGPDGFTSSLQNPTIPSATLAMSGIYIVTGINPASGCTSAPDTIDVFVGLPPDAPVAGSNSPVCSGQPISLTASLITGATYNWTGPGGFTATTQDTTLPAATLAMAGTYSVSVSIGTCVSPIDSTVVIVNPTPVTPVAASNSPICIGSSIDLTSSDATDSISWTGPLGFTSSIQNPTIASSTLDMTGSYAVTAIDTTTGCMSLADTIEVVVSLPPGDPLAASNSPVCSGQSINLTSAAIAFATYSWTGPDGFSSATQNPTLSPATATMSGEYILSASIGTCISPIDTITVIVNPTPEAPIASSNSPVCLDSTITLMATTVGSSTYSWTGPNAFTSDIQNPSITNASLIMSGIYSVIATENGCPSDTATVGVIINDCKDTITTTLNIPDGFSPNGDGVNDLYVIRGIENYPNNNIVIFNRWGNKVFHATPYTNTWDGKAMQGLRVGGDDLPSATYFYVLDLGDGSPVYKGYIYLNK